METTMILPRQLDSHYAKKLADDLSLRRGQPIDIDAKETGFAGALSLQVLIAAALQWKKEGIAFTIRNATESFLSSCDILGFEPVTLGFVPVKEGE